ncbi:hypothetical protein [Xenorhabdus sp. PB30.3]|uniref:hypothetical protein n=1 Tax=Xenorhabdus sp. PB30.3 TaxID=2788941 RepID=UPI001E3CF4D1|nr:hypothetical protein [Xenorhabdus sp. PB30.3]MCC8379543.1 hypothetical protein [Xenorhabdus sp. PB30.3]
MKALTSLERSKLQLNMMARLHDVFGDVKNEVEITPEFIRDTLAQFMQMATGSNYHIAEPINVRFGELGQDQAESFVGSVNKALNHAKSTTSEYPLRYRTSESEYAMGAATNTIESLERIIAEEFSQLKASYKDKAFIGKVGRDGTHIDATFKFNNKKINYSLSGELQIGSCEV